MSVFVITPAFKVSDIHQPSWKDQTIDVRITDLPCQKPPKRGVCNLKMAPNNRWFDFTVRVGDSRLQRGLQKVDLRIDWYGKQE